MTVLPPNRRQLMAIVILMTFLSLTGCITVNTPTAPPPSPATAPTTTNSATPSPSPSETVDTADLVRATVRIIGYDSEGKATCSGSGSILDAAGTILTNLHVIEAGGGCSNNTIGVALTESTDAPAEVAYIARAYAVDANLDLAVIKVETDRDGDQVARDFPHVEVGDSDQVKIGDQLRILGYPGIGGDTITYTEGQVSGFTPAPDIEGRAWIKTQATIAGGNSGGMAADISGRLIGVPTRAGGGGPDDPTTDCRVVQDTDNDGDTDENDKCVPIGGFLNSLRPVGLARDLIARAATAEALSNDDLRSTTETTSPAAVVSDIRFAGDTTDPKMPADAATSLPTTADRVCAFIDYTQMKDGTNADLIWKHDEVVDNTASLYGFEWNLGESGTSSYCTGTSDGQPVGEGLWELSIYLNSNEKAVKTRSVFVGDNHPVGRVTFRNDAGIPICELLVAPHLATEWQNNRLTQDRLLAGGSIDVDLAAGSYDVLGRDCDREEAVRLNAVDLTTDTVVALSP